MATMTAPDQQKLEHVQIFLQAAQDCTTAAHLDREFYAQPLETYIALIDQALRAKKPVEIMLTPEFKKMAATVDAMTSPENLRTLKLQEPQSAQAFWEIKRGIYALESAVNRVQSMHDRSPEAS